MRRPEQTDIRTMEGSLDATARDHGQAFLGLGNVSRVLIGLALTVAVGFLVWWLADWAELADAVGTLVQRPELLAALLVSYTAAFALRAVAWRQLMTGRPGVFGLFTCLQAALLANHLLPFKLGEAARPLLATRRGVPLAEAATTTAVARLLDFGCLILIAAVAGALVASLDGRGEWLRSLSIPIVVVVGAAAGLALLRYRTSGPHGAGVSAGPVGQPAGAVGSNFGDTHPQGRIVDPAELGTGGGRAAGGGAGSGR